MYPFCLSLALRLCRSSRTRLCGRHDRRRGHSLRIAERLHDTGRLICIDRDDEALENAKDRLKDVWQRVTPVKSDFRDIDKVLEGQGLAGADGILFDLAFPLHSWIMPSAAFPTCRMRRSICAWTGSRS